MLAPLEPIDLPDGSEVDVTLDTGTRKADIAAFLRAAGAWRDTIDAEAFIRDIYADRLVRTRPVPSL
jgi:predicted DNA-binding antitoxin AbrB/MazE fold protein